MVTWTRGSGQLAQLSCPCGSEASYLLSQVPLLPVRVRNGNTASHSSRREEGIFPTRSQTRGKGECPADRPRPRPLGPQVQGQPVLSFSLSCPKLIWTGHVPQGPLCPPSTLLVPLGSQGPSRHPAEAHGSTGDPSHRLLLQLSFAVTPAGKDTRCRPG